MKVYIENSNMQVELIRFRQKVITSTFANEEFHSISLTNPIPESYSCQIVSIVIRLNTIGYNGVFAPNYAINLGILTALSI